MLEQDHPRIGERRKARSVDEQREVKRGRDKDRYETTAVAAKRLRRQSRTNGRESRGEESESWDSAPSRFASSRRTTNTSESSAQTIQPTNQSTSHRVSQSVSRVNEATGATVRERWMVYIYIYVIYIYTCTRMYRERKRETEMTPWEFTPRRPGTSRDLSLSRARKSGLTGQLDSAAVGLNMAVRPFGKESSQGPAARASPPLPPPPPPPPPSPPPLPSSSPPSRHYIRVTTRAYTPTLYSALHTGITPSSRDRLPDERKFHGNSIVKHYHYAFEGTRTPALTLSPSLLV